jgi:hypothetical protein
MVQWTSKLEHRKERRIASTANRSIETCVSFAKQNLFSVKRTALWGAPQNAMGEEALPPSVSTETVLIASPDLKPVQQALKFMIINFGAFLLK